MSDTENEGDLGHDVILPAIISVNTRSHKVSGGSITFAAVVAFYEGPVLTGPNVEFTVTYRKGPEANPQGSLYAGQSVKIKTGMIFNVTPTDKS